MSDLGALEQEILGAIAGAPDEAALEAVRVAALGKSGSVSALLRTLGSDDAGGAQGSRGRSSTASRIASPPRSRRAGTRSSTRRSMQRLNTETVDVTLPVREPPAEVGPRPSDHAR